MDKKILIAVLLIFVAFVLFGCTQPYNQNSGANNSPSTITQTNQNSGQPDYTPNSGGTVVIPDNTNTTPVPVNNTPENQQILIQNFSFSPSQVTIQSGTTVVWTNNDSPNHDIVADDGSFKSELLPLNGTYSKTFTTPGTYPYHCGVHPSMKGTIIVQ